jgi:hypothetical protein
VVSDFEPFSEKLYRTMRVTIYLFKKSLLVNNFKNLLFRQYFFSAAWFDTIAKQSLTTSGLSNFHSQFLYRVALKLGSTEKKPHL